MEKTVVVFVCFMELVRKAVPSTFLIKKVCGDLKYTWVMNILTVSL